VTCQVNFRRETKWFDPPGPTVRFFEEAPEDTCIANPVEHPPTLKDAEFVMLVGLPACGKTYWAQKHMEANPQKSYVLLGTNAVIDQMKVMNLTRQRNYAQRWEELMSQATPVFNKLVEIAGNAPRNVILDQTNVYRNARRRKAGAFFNFGTRICVTIVTDDEVLAQRTQKREREEGKIVPVEAVNQMCANFAAPQLGDGFTHLEWPELPERDARRAISDIQRAGSEWQRQNPNAGKGNAPKSRLESRDASSIGSGKGWGKQDVKWEHKRERSRSRSPRGNRGWSWADHGDASRDGQRGWSARW